MTYLPLKPGLIRIMARPGSTILGTHYYQPVALDISDTYGRHLIENGQADLIEENPKAETT